MKLKNTSNRNYMFGLEIFKAGETIEVEDKKTAETLLKQEGIEEVIDKEEVEKLKAELEAVKAEKVATQPKATKKTIKKK